MNMSGWMIPPTALVMWLYQGLPYAGLGLVCGWLNLRKRPAGPLFCASLLTLLVFFRPKLCPVSAVVSVAFWPRFIQVADIGGENLVFFILIFVNFVVADLLACLVARQRGKALIRGIVLCLVLAAVLGYGSLSLSRYREPETVLSARTLSVATLQPNALLPSFLVKKGVPLNEVVTPETKCLGLFRKNLGIVRSADLVVLPELPRFDCRDVEFRLSGLEKAIQHLGVPVLMPSAEILYGKRGSSKGDGMRQMVTTPILAKYSTVFIMRPGAKHPLPVYRKIRRVPFAEAVHNLPWHHPSLGVSSGTGVRLIRVKGVSVQPMICFESGFSDLARQGAALSCDVMVEVSNDGWFDSGDAEMKHLGMAIFRAVEIRRPLVRCSNTGRGAHVSAAGEIILGTLTPHAVSTVTRARVVCPDETPLYLKIKDGWLWIIGTIAAWQIAATLAVSPTRNARGIR